MERMVDAKEMAELLGVGRKQVYRLAQCREIPYHKVGGCLRFIPTEVLSACPSGGPGDQDG